MATWKARERAVALALGGKRAPNDGLAHSDVVGVPWAVEVKHTKRAFSTAEKQARTQGKLERKPWLLVVCRYNQRLEDATVSMSLRDFLDLARAAGLVPAAETPLDALAAELEDTRARARTDAMSEAA